jgi:cytohesin
MISPERPKLGDPLSLAAQSGDDAIISILVRAGHDPNATDKTGYTPLHWAVIFKHSSTISLLAHLGADVNAQDATHYRCTPLHLAASSGYEWAISKFVQVGADVNVRDAGRYTALYYACANNELSTVSLLLSLGAEITPEALHVAAEKGFDSIVSLLIQKGANINMRDAENNTPLHRALAVRQFSTASLLIRLGADINARIDDSNELTLLNLAIGRKAPPQLIEELLAYNNKEVSSNNNSIAYQQDDETKIRTLCSEEKLKSEEGIRKLVEYMNQGMIQQAWQDLN